MNDSGEIVGDFLSKKDGYYHGFTDIGGKLTQYDVPGERAILTLTFLGSTIMEIWPARPTTRVS